MFVKLIVLILALGSTGVGVLSVRQSRLVASNEMTQARMRSRQLDRRTMELRAQIASRITPDQIRVMLKEQLGDQFQESMILETQRRIALLDPVEPTRTPVQIQLEDVPVIEPEAETEPGPEYWTLDDGTRVYVIDAPRGQ